MSKLISIVDSGKNAIKITILNEDYEILARDKFPSKHCKKRNFRGIETSEKQYKVTMKKDGREENYLVGENKGTYSFDKTKNNFHHILCILVAVGNNVTELDQEVDLVVGYPSTDYSNKQQTLNFRNELLNKGLPIEMKINDRLVRFKINNVEVYAEGMGVSPRLNLIRNNQRGQVYVIDIGGQNLNLRHYSETGSSFDGFSLDEAGMNHVEKAVENLLRSSIDVDKYDISAINYTKAIRNGYIEELDKFNGLVLEEFKNTKELVHEAVCSFIEDSILLPLQSRGYDLQALGRLIVLSGGGSLALRPYLEELLEENKNANNLYFSPTAQWDNIISYLIRHLKEEIKDNEKRNKIMKDLIKEITNSVLKENQEIEKNHDIIDFL